MTDNEYSIDITPANFEQVIITKSQDVPVLVDIWAPWCEPCKSLKPILEKLVNEYQGKFILAKLNSEEHQDLAQQFGVRSIPTVKAIYRGKLLNEFSGALPESEVRKFIDSVIPSPTDDLRMQASEQIQQGNIEQAHALLDQAIALDPEQPALKADKAALLIGDEKLEDAKTLLDALPPQYKSEEHVKKMLAHIEIKQKSEGLADESVLLDQIAADPANLQARLDLANLYIAQENHAAAIEQCLEIIKTDREFKDDIGRKTMLDIFTLLGNGNPLVRTSRRQLSSLLN